MRHFEKSIAAAAFRPSQRGKVKQIVLLIAVFAVLIAAAVFFGLRTWNAIGPTAMGFHGWFALVLMVILTLAVGVGLMGLVFYSSRKGYDDFQDQDQDPDER